MKERIEDATGNIFSFLADSQYSFHLKFNHMNHPVQSFRALMTTPFAASCNSSKNPSTSRNPWRLVNLVVIILTLFVSSGYATDGTGVATVTANGNSCVSFTPAQSDGPDNWEVAEGGSYTMTLTGVTECSGNTITVFIQNSHSGNFCFNATGGNGTYVGTFTVPNPTCNTMPVSYKCGADQPCNNDGTYNADGPSGTNKVHLRASTFDGACNKTGGDADCNSGSNCVCEPPSNITVDSVSAAEALICWDGNEGCDQAYIIAWRTVPQTEWLYSTVSAPDQCLIFTNHYDDVYEIQIASICHDGDTSAYGPIYTFATYASCLPPTNPFTSNIKATQAKVNWTGVSDASKYVISYRQTGVGNWTKKNVSADKTSYILKDLTASTQYEWKVASKCIGTSRSVTGPNTALQSFTTLAQRVSDDLSPSLSSNIKLYPNPAHDHFTIELQTDANSASVVIENALGQIVYSSHPETVGGRLKETISFDQPLNEGIYIIHVTAGDKEFSGQLFISK